MGRFSDMLGEKGVDAAPTPTRASGYQGQHTPVKGQTEAASATEWLIYNGRLGSPSKGLKYRSTPDLTDLARGRKLAEFGETVLGVPTDDGWLRVGRLYLPMEMNGVPVLIPTDNGTEQVEEEDPRERWKKWKMPTPSTTPPERQGKGTRYEVIHDRVVGRPAPSVAAPMQTLRSKGEVIELFEFDETWKWRLGIDDKSLHMVWFMIDHPDYGPLLRPQGQPLSVKPMEPVCVAARENLSSDLQRFLDQGAEANVYEASGRSALMLAAENDNLECCILLVEGGADATLRSVPPCVPHGKTAVQMAASAQMKALLKGICGYRDFDMRNLDRATASLGRNEQETVDRLLEIAEQEVSKGSFLVEGQEPLHPGQEAAKPPEPPTTTADYIRELAPQPSPAAAARREEYEDGTHSVVRRGVLHEVVYNAVWIRKEASVDASKIAVKKQGEYVELFEVDKSGDWALVEHEVYEGHFITGWMLIKHESLGMLLKPVQQGRAFQELS